MRSEKIIDCHTQYWPAFPVAVIVVEATFGLSHYYRRIFDSATENVSCPMFQETPEHHPQCPRFKPVSLRVKG